jgi:hypothetical protein
VAAALGGGAAVGVAACGEKRGDVQIEGDTGTGTNTTGTSTTGTAETSEKTTTSKTSTSP